MVSMCVHACYIYAHVCAGRGVICFDNIFGTWGVLEERVAEAWLRRIMRGLECWDEDQGGAGSFWAGQ